VLTACLLVKEIFLDIDEKSIYLKSRLSPSGICQGRDGNTVRLAPLLSSLSQSAIALD
jgi:hypothetical protein